MIAFSRRIASIDIFRGLTMLVMIFVNDLAGVRQLPWWTYHMPGNVSGMTYVDVVFPAFLFLVGLSIPVAVANRISRENVTGKLWTHVILRSGSLVVLGVGLANVEKGNPHMMSITRDMWGSLFLLSAIVFCNTYPKRFRAARFAGLAGLLVLLAMFRRSTATGEVRWLDISYWEILGLIGWTYLAVCIVFIPTRTWRWAPPLALFCFVVLNVLSTAQWLQFPESLPFYLWPFNNGAFVTVTMAGVVTTSSLLSDEARRLRNRSVWTVAFGAGLLVLGWLTSPLGISKIGATPSWALYSAGISVLIFAALHWVCDTKGRTRWARFSAAAGENTLLTYLLPDLFLFAIGTRWIPPAFQSGWAGVLRSVLFTAGILAASEALTRMQVRLRL